MRKFCYQLLGRGKCLFLVVLCFLAAVVAVAAERNAITGGYHEVEDPLEAIMTEADCLVPDRPQVALALGAANGWTDWDAVEEFSDGSWSIQFANLDGFGRIMRERGFQAALDTFGDQLQRAITQLQPSVLIVASKGLGILTYLANQNLYTGPAVLLSPIPNTCDHIHGDSWEEEWTSTLKILSDKDVGSVAVGVGTSHDEQTLILDLIEETQFCGDLLDAEDCDQLGKGCKRLGECPRLWFQSFPGGHGWKNDPDNAEHIANLIHFVTQKM